MTGPADRYAVLLDAAGRDVRRVVAVLEPPCEGGATEVLYIGAHGPMAAVFVDDCPIPAHVREGW